MNNDQKIIWIDALLARNDNKLEAPLILPHGLLSQDGVTFKFKGGSFAIEEARQYMEHGTLSGDSDRLTKRQEVALRIYCSGEGYTMKISYKLADEFLEESRK
jgi:hypothetical protein